MECFGGCLCCHLGSEICYAFFCLSVQQQHNLFAILVVVARLCILLYTCIVVLTRLSPAKLTFYTLRNIIAKSV